MNASKTRIVHEYTQENPTGPEQVFPLLCPVKEAEWVPGWEYRLVYSQSGLAELGCVFTTPNEDGSESTWVCTVYEPPRRIGFVWVWPGMVTAQLEFTLSPAEGGRTRLRAQYVYTALSERGEAEVARYDADWFANKMRHFESALNQYLAGGKKAAQRWE